MRPAITSFTGDYRFLSNFWLSPVSFEGMAFSTVEHAYQAAKTLDMDDRKRIAQLGSPGMAKRIGRLVTMRPDWEQVKLDVMLQLLLQKFQHEPLRSMLLATTNAELIEGNTWGDVFWGVCRGVGQNHLGKLLMKVRHECSRASNGL